MKLLAGFRRAAENLLICVVVCAVCFCLYCVSYWMTYGSIWVAYHIEFYATVFFVDESTAKFIGFLTGWVGFAGGYAAFLKLVNLGLMEKATAVFGKFKLQVMLRHLEECEPFWLLTCLIGFLVGALGGAITETGEFVGGFCGLAAGVIVSLTVAFYATVTGREVLGED